MYNRFLSNEVETQFHQYLKDSIIESHKDVNTYISDISITGGFENCRVEYCKYDKKTNKLVDIGNFGFFRSNGEYHNKFNLFLIEMRDKKIDSIIDEPKI